MRILFQRLGDGPVAAHLDIACSDVDAVAAQHEALGAVVEEHHAWWTTLRDPAGVRYCLIRRTP